MATTITNPSMQQIVEQLNRRLRRLESQAPADYDHAGAMVEGRRIQVWTHSYRPAQKLTKSEAIAFYNTLQ